MKAVAKKPLTRFRTQIRSRHPSHSWLKKSIGMYPFRSIVRLGSITPTDVIFRKRTPEQRSRVIECNSVESIKNSSNKLLMKNCFKNENVKTADWWTPGNIPNDAYPIVIKHIYGSRGKGNTLVHTKEEFQNWVDNKRADSLDKYIFERYYTYSREYRLHVTKDGCFYTCRKVLKKDTPEKDRWFRNDSNSAWILEENELFDKPVNWNEIVEHSVKAIKAVGLDIGCTDVKVQSAKDSKGNVRKTCEFIILETNSAPSFGDITQEKYLKEIPKVLISKFNLRRQNRG